MADRPFRLPGGYRGNAARETPGGDGLDPDSRYLLKYVVIHRTELEHVVNEHVPYAYLVRRVDIEAAEDTFRHPWNPNSEITGTHLSALAGLQRTGVSLARLAPGRESFAYHLHHREEEWIYLLSGRAVTRIDGHKYTLETGDFVAFPTPSVPHLLANPGPDELVYLMGGENRRHDVADFPELDRRMVKLNGEVTVYRLSDGQAIDDAGPLAD